MTSEPCINSLLLTGLSANELSQLIPLLRPTPLIRKKVIYNVGDEIDFVYFPSGGLISEMAILADGGGLEVITIGREGAFGISALYGSLLSAHEITVQISGAAWCVSIAALRRLLNTCPILRDRLSAYSQALFLEAAQTAACTGRHSVPQRCASKLLNASRRSGTNNLPLTHENIAHSLGVRRAGVTNAIAEFERKGSIQCMRGAIEILDVAQLAAAACECSDCKQSDVGAPQMGAVSSRQGRTGSIWQAEKIGPVARPNQ